MGDGESPVSWTVHFRRLDAPELLREVAEGVAYVDGAREKRGNAKAAA